MNTTIHAPDWKRSITESRAAPNSILQSWISRWAFIGVLMAPASLDATPAREPLDIGRMVEVLKMMENGPASNPWQFTESTWKAYSKVPMKTASPWEHRRVAWMFLGACVRQCSALDMIITPEAVALFFHAGFGNVRDKTITAAQRDYSQRAANLYHDAK